MEDHRPKRLLDQVRDAVRLKHYSYRTEQACVRWIKRYIRFQSMRYPSEMGAPEVEAFLTHLAPELAREARSHMAPRLSDRVVQGNSCSIQGVSEGGIVSANLWYRAVRCSGLACTKTLQVTTSMVLLLDRELQDSHTCGSFKNDPKSSFLREPPATG